MAEVPLYESGLPYARRSLSKLSAYLIKQRVVKTISREHLAQVLKGGWLPVPCPTQDHQPKFPAAVDLEPSAGCAAASAQERCSAVLRCPIDPCQSVWGRRFTSAKRLVLARHQKTRGWCYLFLFHDVGSNEAH